MTGRPSQKRSGRDLRSRRSGEQLPLRGLSGGPQIRQRGISAEDAVSMIVNGFCREVFKELPMEFAVEAQKLLGVSLEGSVG